MLTLWGFWMSSYGIAKPEMTVAAQCPEERVMISEPLQILLLFLPCFFWLTLVPFSLLPMLSSCTSFSPSSVFLMEEVWGIWVNLSGASLSFPFSCPFPSGSWAIVTSTLKLSILYLGDTDLEMSGAPLLCPFPQKPTQSVVCHFFLWVHKWLVV